jgi:hypothetical protein
MGDAALACRFLDVSVFVSDFGDPAQALTLARMFWRGFEVFS